MGTLENGGCFYGVDITGSVCDGPGTALQGMKNEGSEWLRCLMPNPFAYQKIWMNSIMDYCISSKMILPQIMPMFY